MMFIESIFGDMRTVWAIRKELLNEVKLLSGAKTRNAVGKVLVDFIGRRKAKKLLQLEGKTGLSFSGKELLARRRIDLP